MNIKENCSQIMLRPNIGICHDLANQFAEAIGFLEYIDHVIAIRKDQHPQRGLGEQFVQKLAEAMGYPSENTPEEFREVLLATFGALSDLKVFAIGWKPEAALKFINYMATNPWMDRARIAVRLDAQEEIGCLHEVEMDAALVPSVSDYDRAKALASTIAVGHDLAPMLLRGLVRSAKSGGVGRNGTSIRVAYIESLSRLQFFICSLRDAAGVARAIVEEGVKCDIITLGPFLDKETISDIYSGHDLPAGFANKAVFRAILNATVGGKFSETDIEQFFPDDGKKGTTQQSATSPQVNTSATGNAPSASGPKSEPSAIPRRSKQNDEPQR